MPARIRLLPACLWFLVLASPLLGAEGKCGLCHPQEQVLAKDSVHASEGIGCAGCHGGDPTTVDEAAAHGDGFQALTDRREIPRACATCHADQEMMRPYNLPVGQYALYQTSQHGKALARGDDRAAVCTDCHGLHEVRRADSPRSPVNIRNVGTTCGRCHGDRVLMERYGHDADVLADYEESVHGRAVSDGNLGAPTCINCHGVHGATPPGVGDLDKVCGNCHTQTRQAFLDGPHHEAMAAANLPECQSCHSNHAIERFGFADLRVLCSECHDEGSEAVGVGLEMQTLVVGAVSAIDRAEQLTVEAERVPLNVEDHLARLTEARTQITESLSLMHAVSVEPVDAVARRARSIGDEVHHELTVKMDRTNAYIGLAVFWFYLAVTLAILFVYKRRLARQRVSR